MTEKRKAICCRCGGYGGEPGENFGDRGWHSSHREWLLTAYREGGYERFRRVPPFGFLVTDDMPLDIERALCAALGTDR